MYGECTRRQLIPLFVLGRAMLAGAKLMISGELINFARRWRSDNSTTLIVE